MEHLGAHLAFAKGGNTAADAYMKALKAKRAANKARAGGAVGTGGGDATRLPAEASNDEDEDEDDDDL